MGVYSSVIVFLNHKIKKKNLKKEDFSVAAPKAFLLVR